MIIVIGHNASLFWVFDCQLQTMKQTISIKKSCNLWHFILVSFENRDWLLRQGVVDAPCAIQRGGDEVLPCEVKSYIKYLILVVHQSPDARACPKN